MNSTVTGDKKEVSVPVVSSVFYSRWSGSTGLERWTTTPDSLVRVLTQTTGTSTPKPPTTTTTEGSQGGYPTLRTGGCETYGSGVKKLMDRHPLPVSVPRQSQRDK